MKVNINKNCIGCGLCAADCPNNFEMNESGVAQVINNESIEENKEDIINAQQNCPAEAIDVEE